MMKPIFKYRGGKSKEIKEFASYFPKNFDTYFEPFLGGGAVYFSLGHKKSVINDINTKLITAYKEIRDNYPVVRKQLNSLQQQYEANQRVYESEKNKLNDTIKFIENKNELLYYEFRKQYNNPSREWLDSVVYYFINKTAYSGMTRYNSKGEFNVPFGRYRSFNTQLLTQGHCDLLKSTKIYNKNYKEIFKMAKSNDFMFLDPPYDCVFTSYGNEVFSGDFKAENHIQLAQDFKELDCMALMVISKTPLTQELYADYIVAEYHKNYSVNIRNRFKNEAKHLVIKNRHF